MIPVTNNQKMTNYIRTKQSRYLIIKTKHIIRLSFHLVIQKWISKHHTKMVIVSISY